MNKITKIINESINRKSNSNSIKAILYSLVVVLLKNPTRESLISDSLDEFLYAICEAEKVLEAARSAEPSNVVLNDTALNDTALNDAASVVSTAFSALDAAAVALDDAAAAASNAAFNDKRAVDVDVASDNIDKIKLYLITAYLYLNY
jgi:hypothetical protein